MPWPRARVRIFTPEGPKTMQPKLAAPLILTAIVTCIGLYFAFDSTGKFAADPRNLALHSALTSCPSYESVAGDIRVGYTVNGDITIDLRKVKGGCRRIDPIHLILQLTGKLKDYKISYLILACQGKEKYRITKSDVDRLALNYDNDARGWSFMHLPELLLRPDGTHPFGTWEGGFLGVMSHQIEDLSTFMKELEDGLTTT